MDKLLSCNISRQSWFLEFSSLFLVFNNSTSVVCVPCLGAFVLSSAVVLIQFFVIVEIFTAITLTWYGRLKWRWNSDVYTMKMLADLNLLIKLKICFKFQNHFLQQNCTTTVLWCCIFCRLWPGKGAPHEKGCGACINCSLPVIVWNSN